MSLARYPGYRQLEQARTVWLLVAAWAVGVCALSAQPGGIGPGAPFGIPHFDKALHFTAYAVGAFLLDRALGLRFGRLRAGARLAVVVLALGLFAAMDEVHQTFVPGRSGIDPGDWVADLTGAVAGGILSRICHG